MRIKKSLKNVKLERNCNNSAATVAMVYYGVSAQLKQVSPRYLQLKIAVFWSLSS